MDPQTWRPEWKRRPRWAGAANAAATRRCPIRETYAECQAPSEICGERGPGEAWWHPVCQERLPLQGCRSSTPSCSFTLISGTVAGLPSINKSFLYNQCLQVKSCTINGGILDISCSFGVSPFGPFGRVFSLNHPREGQPGLFTGFALRTHLVSDYKTGCSLWSWRSGHKGNVKVVPFSPSWKWGRARERKGDPTAWHVVLRRYFPLWVKKPLNLVSP